MIVVLYLKEHIHTAAIILLYAYIVVVWWMIVVLHLKEHIHTAAIMLLYA